MTAVFIEQMKCYTSIANERHNKRHAPARRSQGRIRYEVTFAILIRLFSHYEREAYHDNDHYNNDNMHIIDEHFVSRQPADDRRIFGQTENDMTKASRQDRSKRLTEADGSQAVGLRTCRAGPTTLWESDAEITERRGVCKKMPKMPKKTKAQNVGMRR